VLLTEELATTTLNVVIEKLQEIRSAQKDPIKEIQKRRRVKKLQMTMGMSMEKRRNRKMKMFPNMKSQAGIKKEKMSQKRRRVKNPRSLMTKIAAIMKKENTSMKLEEAEITRPEVNP
jgi:hypothetical protein